MSEVPRDVLIILIVIALLIGLGLVVGISVYLCYFRRRQKTAASSSKQRHRHSKGQEPGRKRPLPSAAAMKRTDRGENIDGDTSPGDIAIMGAQAADNEAFDKGGPSANRHFLRDANDPADVAYAYMKGDVPQRKPRSKQEPNFEVSDNKKKQPGKGKSPENISNGKGIPAHKRSHWDDPPDNSSQIPLPQTDDIYQNAPVSKSGKPKA